MSLIQFNNVNGQNISFDTDEKIFYQNKILEKKKVDNAELKVQQRVISILEKKKIHISFNSSEICNLKCRYCFANSGTYNNKSDKKFYTYEQYVNTYEKLSEKYDIDAIDFFGGEPLLNFSEISKFLSYLKELKKKVDLSIITNGTLINDDVVSCIKNNDVKLTISLDGPKYINDKNRKSDYFTSVHDVILENMNKLDVNNIRYACEATLSYDVLQEMEKKEIEEYIQYFINSKFYAIAIFHENSNSSDDYKNNKKLINKIELFYDIYIKKCVELVESGKNNIQYHHGIMDIFVELLFNSSADVCMAGINKLFITVDGSVYPCQAYYMSRKNKLGNIMSITDVIDSQKKLYNSVVKNRVNQKCLNCEYFEYCGAFACSGRNLSNNGDESKYNEIDCIINKIKINKILEFLSILITDTNRADKFIRNLQNINVMSGDKKNVQC